MKVIEIKELKTVPASIQATSFEEFESVISIAGHYAKTIDEEEIVEHFSTGLFNYLYDRLVDTFEDDFKNSDDEDVLSDAEDLLADTLDEIVGDADIPDDLAAYTNDVYIELDSICKSLCYIKDNTPDFSSTYEAYYAEHINVIKQKLSDALKAHQAELEENTRQQAIIENQKSKLFTEARVKYQEAVTVTERNRIVNELRVELGQRYNEKMTKDEVIFKLTR